MPKPIISVRNLGKRYKIGGPKARYKTLRESIANRITSPFRNSGNPKSTDIWALKDVSFEVQQGDIVGIIGPNGAGKTTLLKILSRITTPTIGEVDIRGRVGSLLEVGTGFHPELTGRENIYLNGAILGMSRAEIDRKFDEIVSFAEIETFLDTPVKRYSTGMGTRLAFAVAAYLDPEILLVDEILAVGDLAFRKKCLGKMQGVSQEGRTVLFVSHDMNTMRRLCKKGILLKGGIARSNGEIHEVVKEYEASIIEKNNGSASIVQRDVPPSSQKHFTSISLSTTDHMPNSCFGFGDSIKLIIESRGVAPAGGIHYVEWFLNERNHGIRVAWGGTYSRSLSDFPRDWKRISFNIGPLPLAKGTYAFSIVMGVAGVLALDSWNNAILLEVHACIPQKKGYDYSTQYAPVYIPFEIEVEKP